MPDHARIAVVATARQGQDRLVAFGRHPGEHRRSPVFVIAARAGPQSAVGQADKVRSTDALLHLVKLPPLVGRAAAADPARADEGDNFVIRHEAEGGLADARRHELGDVVPLEAVGGGVEKAPARPLAFVELGESAADALRGVLLESLRQSGRAR